MTRLAGVFLVIGVLFLGLVGCDSFFQFNGSDGAAGEQPAGQELIYDDFEDGPSSRWRYSSNFEQYWTVEDGQYTIDREGAPEGIPFQTYVGSESWADYSVEMDVLNLAFDDQQMAILLRVQSEDQMVAFAMCTTSFCDRAELRIKQEGTWTTIESIKNPKEGNFHILATVQRNRYSIAINGSQVLEIEIPDFPTTGFAGIQAANGGQRIAFDNFRVIEQ